MKFLFDENISYKIVKKIKDIVPNSIHVNRSGLKMPADDIAIWNFARKNGFTLVSFDEDFQDLSHLYGFPPKVILLRIGNSSTQSISDILLLRWKDIEQFLISDNHGLLEIF